MLEPITISSPEPFSLRSAYIALSTVQNQKEAIDSTIEVLFTKFLNNSYQYEIIPENNEEEIPTRTVSISRKDIGQIGTATFQFSEDSIKGIFCSNSVIFKIMRESAYPQESQQIAENKTFLKFGANLERFNQVWVKAGKTRPAPAVLEMSFFGKITETAEQHETKDLAGEIVRRLGKCYRVPEQEELENRCQILDVLTRYIETGRISPEDIQTMRAAASALQGADANFFRKLSVAAMAISLPTFIGSVTLIVFAMIALGPVAAIIGAILTAASLMAFIGGALWAFGKGQPDFPSRAVLYLAGKIGNEQLSSQNVVNTLGNLPVSEPELKPSPPFFKPVPIQESFENFCDESLKPALEKVFGQKISSNHEVFQTLRDQLAAPLNRGEKIDIDGLKTKFDKIMLIEDKQKCLKALYETCGVDPKDIPKDIRQPTF